VVLVWLCALQHPLHAQRTWVGLGLGLNLTLPELGKDFRPLAYSGPGAVRGGAVVNVWFWQALARGWRLNVEAGYAGAVLSQQYNLPGPALGKLNAPYPLLYASPGLTLQPFQRLQAYAVLGAVAAARLAAPVTFVYQDGPTSSRTETLEASDLDPEQAFVALRLGLGGYVYLTKKYLLRFEGLYDYALTNAVRGSTQARIPQLQLRILIGLRASKR
jgi:hypothetical protein